MIFNRINALLHNTYFRANIVMVLYPILYCGCSLYLTRNAAYILGSLAEDRQGCTRILDSASIYNLKGWMSFPDTLILMLTSQDTETVLNAAGTLGTIAEFDEGREWLLNNIGNFTKLLEHSTKLLQSSNQWVASNAALVLARFSISDKGLRMIMERPQLSDTLVNLINCLGVDKAGCGMNCAFTLGRICDSSLGIRKVLEMPNKAKLLTGISIMLAEIPLNGSNWGVCKNACFCFSCLASTKEGQDWIVHMPRFLTGNDYFFTIDGDESSNRTPSEQAETADKCCALASLTNLLDMTDMETSWFAAMAIRSLISHPQGLITVRRYQPLVNALRVCLLSEKTCPELREEAKIIIYLLGPLPPAPRPKVIAYGQTSALVRWTSLDSPGRLPVTYKLYIQSEESSEPKLAYFGSNLETRVRDLTPYTRYTITLRSCTDAEESPCSESVTLLTEEAIPSAPCDFRATTVTTTQVRLVWSPPRSLNGVMRYYLVRVECAERRQSTPVVTTAGLQWKRPLSGLRYNEKTTETNAIISGLLPKTLYTFSVCLVNGKGAGPSTALTLKTLDSGIRWPSKPMVTVLGRSEVTVSWEPPKLTPGRIMRYEVYLNRKKTPVYSGTAHHCRLIGLRPDTEYSFVVIVVTNTGKFESESIKKRTPRDEYACSARPSVPEFSWHKQPRQDSHGSLQPTFTLENKTSLSTSDKPLTADNKGKSTYFSWLTSVSMPCLINNPEVKMVDSMKDSQRFSPKKATELKPDRARFQSVTRSSPRTCHIACKRNTSQPPGRATSPRNQTPNLTNSDMGDKSSLSDHATSLGHLGSGEKPMVNPEPARQLTKCALAYLCKGMVASSRPTARAVKQQTSRLPLPLEKADGSQNISAETTGSHNLTEGMPSLITGEHLDPSLYCTGKKSNPGFLRLPFRVRKSKPLADTYQITTVQDIPNNEVNSLNQTIFQPSSSIPTLRPPTFRLIPPSNLKTTKRRLAGPTRLVGRSHCKASRRCPQLASFLLQNTDPAIIRQCTRNQIRTDCLNGVMGHQTISFRKTFGPTNRLYSTSRRLLRAIRWECGSAKLQ
ncbi:hypothetical protein AHF37_03912 [Paragonimus kellicotti]|nr:hypothetical protein AHF37_03912 [Paragonimus kellicotti]